MCQSSITTKAQSNQTINLKNNCATYTHTTLITKKNKHIIPIQAIIKSRLMKPTKTLFNHSLTITNLL